MSTINQDGSWKIVLNGQTKLQASKEDEKANVVTIPKEELTRTGVFAVNYEEKPLQAGWVRVIAVVDPEDNVLSRHAGNYLRLQNPVIKNMLVNEGPDTLHVYSWATPINPKDAANMRIRRVHLGTLIFK